MTTRLKRVWGRFVLPLVAATVLSGGAARAATATWTGATNNNWSTSSNWSWAPSCGGCVPGNGGGAGATVQISSGTVSVDTSVGSVASISISGGTVSVSGSATTITTTGAFNLSGGTFTSGSAATNTIVVGGDLALSNVDASLVGYWKLDDTSSPAVDSSAGGHNLTWTVSPTSSASVPTVGFSDPHSMSFVTANRDALLLAMPASMQLALPITLSAWYRATATDTNGGEIVSGADSYVLRLTPTGVDVVKYIGSNTWVTLSASPSTYLDGNWHQIVGVFGTAGMTAYFDGTQVASNASSSAIVYPSPAALNLAIARNGGSNATTDFGGNIDDVRIYNRAITAGEISTLSAGSQAGTFALSSPLTLSGNLTVQSSGTLTLSGANAAVSMASGKTITMDGTLNSSTSASTGPVIKSSAGTYAFYVGSANGAAPTLNISNLTVKNGDLNGMRVNGNGSGTTTATTTFKQFDNVTFSNGTASASSGVAYLQIYGSTLYLVSNGCSFGAGEASAALPAAAVKLTGDGFTNGATETRAIFGGTACAATWTGGGSDTICLQTAKSDDDSGNDGIGDHPSGAGINGAVVQFVRAAESDVKGSIEGFPTAAFNWTTFAYYSTYVAYHDADSSGTKDRVYVRKTDGTAATSTYYWEANAGDTIIGTPRWSTSSGGTHYVYVAVTSGKVYQLVDDTTNHTLSTTGASWSPNPFVSATTITTPLSVDASNVYFAGTASGNKFWSLLQTTGLPVSGFPYGLAAAATGASLAIWTSSGVTYVTVGMNGQIYHVDLSNLASTYGNTAPTGNVISRIGYGNKTLTTLFVSDDQGNMLGIDPLNSTNGSRWSFAASGTTVSPSYYDYTGDTLMFGTSQGKIFSLSTASAASTAAMTGYTTGYQPNSNADAFATAPVYVSGILAIGNSGSATNGGKLYFIDRNTKTSSPCIPGSAPNLLRQYNFGPSENVSGVGFDASSSRYMAATSSSSGGDGRLYYIDLITDQTSCN